MAVSSEEILKLIAELNYEEKQKVLDKNDEYYSGGGAVLHVVKEENQKKNPFLTDQELDIAFLTDKINKLEKEVFFLKRKKEGH